MFLGYVGITLNAWYAFPVNNITEDELAVTRRINFEVRWFIVIITITNTVLCYKFQ